MWNACEGVRFIGALFTGLVFSKQEETGPEQESGTTACIHLGVQGYERVDSRSTHVLLVRMRNKSAESLSCASIDLIIPLRTYYCSFGCTEALSTPLPQKRKKALQDQVEANFLREESAEFFEVSKHLAVFFRKVKLALWPSFRF